MKEYKLPDNAKPHSVTPDPAANIGYTGNSNATIGKLDPRTGTISEYKMPNPDARDPHTAEFDKNGTLWFTLQQSNMVGRLNPATGEIKLVKMPTAKSRPYGIKVAADGSLWVACNGSNCIVRVDPKTMDVRECKLPIEKTTVRRLDIASDGIIWYVNSSQGRLGRLDQSQGRSRNGRRPAARNLILTQLRWWTVLSGITNRASSTYWQHRNTAIPYMSDLHIFLHSHIINKNKAFNIK
jgi:virginiamycin B lyase